MNHVLFAFVIFSSVILFGGCTAPEKKIEKLPDETVMASPEAKRLRALVPDTVGENWELLGCCNYYGSEELSSYLPDTKDLYLLFGVSGLGVFKYSNGDAKEDIFCEVYELPDTEHAFALFCYFHEEGAEDWDGGLAGIRDSYGITFCAARYYVRVNVLHEYWGAGAVCDELAMKTLENIGEKGEIPQAFRQLPGEDMVKGSEKYFAGCEQGYFYFPNLPETVLCEKSSGGAFARYVDEKGKGCYLLIIEYPDVGTCEKAFADYREWAGGQRSSAFYDIGVTYYFGGGPGNGVSLFAATDERLLVAYDYGREADFAKKILKAACLPSKDLKLAEIYM